MRTLCLFLLGICGIGSFAQETLDVLDSNSAIQIPQTDTLVLLDTATMEEAKVFKEETHVINDSLEVGEEKVIKVSESILDTTQPYGIKFIKEFEMSGGVYHYLILDVQYQEKFFHKPHWLDKEKHYDYEDWIVKLEHRGEKMNLYSIILEEPITGSLVRFEKNYFVSDGRKVLRVYEKAHHNRFFKEFERLYLGGDDTVLKGKKFKNIFSLVSFYNEYDPSTENETSNSNKYELVD